MGRLGMGKRSGNKQKSKKNETAVKTPPKPSRFKEPLDLRRLKPIALLKWEFMRDDPSYTPRYIEFKALCVRILAENITDLSEYRKAIRNFQEDFGIAFPIDPSKSSEDLSHEEIMWVLSGVNRAPYIYSKGIEEYLQNFFMANHTYMVENQTFANETHLDYLEFCDPEKTKAFILGGMDDLKTVTIQINMQRVNSITALKAFLDETVDGMAKLIQKDAPNYLRDKRRLKEILELGRKYRSGITHRKLAETLYENTPKEDSDEDKGVAWRDAIGQEKYIARVSEACKAYQGLIQGGYKKIVFP